MNEVLYFIAKTTYNTNNKNDIATPSSPKALIPIN